MPTSGPTSGPSSGPTSGPTSSPTSSPTSVPTTEPTSDPTSWPTSTPTRITPYPTLGPTSAAPTGCANYAVRVDEDCGNSKINSTAVNIENSKDGEVTWNIDNWFGKDISWMQIVHKETDGTLGSTGKISLQAGQSTGSFTSKCNGDWATLDISVAQYPMALENKDICDGWDPESDICSYRVKLSCVCGGTPVPTARYSPAPTACREVSMQHEDLVVDWPADAGPEFIRRDNNTGEVTLRFNQTFQTTQSSTNPSSSGSCSGEQIDWVAFVYDDNDSNSNCTKQNSLCRDDTFETTVQCGPDDQFKVITVYISDDHVTFSAAVNENPGSCTGWPSDNRNVAKYTFEVPCNVDPCRPIENAPAPTTSTPSTVPTIVPTYSPTTSPPSTVPTYSPAPTVCEEVELLHEDTYVDWPLDAGPEVVYQNLTSGVVTVRFNQTFITSSVNTQGACPGQQIDWVAFVSDETSTQKTCTMQNSLCYDDLFETQIRCSANDDSKTLTLYVSDDHTDFSLSVNANPDGLCPKWTNSNGNVAKYTFRIPCKASPCIPRTRTPTTLPPTLSPSVSPTIRSGCPARPNATCPDDIELVDHIGDTLYSESPIRLIDQNTSTTTFSIENTFGVPLDRIFVQYHDSAEGDTNCTETQGIALCETDLTFTAFCMTRKPITIVDLWIIDSSLDAVVDNATVPDCCKPSEQNGGSGPKVQYTFMIHCESKCATIAPGSSRLLSGGNQPDEIKGFQKPHRKSKKPSPLEIAAEANGGHYCTKEDHPCGLNNENVHVCHYSARDGYQTFCVPEEDTDILAYYPKDHCGPCFGGFAKKSHQQQK
jgi:hypothetical protein